MLLAQMLVVWYCILYVGIPSIDRNNDSSLLFVCALH